MAFKLNRKVKVLRPYFLSVWERARSQLGTRCKKKSFRNSFPVRNELAPTSFPAWLKIRPLVIVGIHLLSFGLGRVNNYYFGEFQGLIIIHFSRLCEHFCLKSEHIFFSSRFRENSPLTLDSNTQVFPTTTTSDGSGSGESSYYESVFRLNNVHPDQSGEFECRPQGLPSAKVNLHIVKGNLS
jgi:hypothetical protein